MKLLNIFSAILLFLLVACNTGYKDITTTDNFTLSQIDDSRFINKAFLLLMGREPVQTELDKIDSLKLLATNREQERQIIVDYILGDASFFENMKNVFMQEYLEGTSIEEIKQNLISFDLLKISNKNKPLFDYYEYEYNRLEALRRAIKQNASGETRLKELQKRMIDNYIYDQINMGLDNFVLSSFQHLLLRKPTRYELEQGKKMCSGANGYLFFKKGSSKEDYLTILVNSDNYYEGQIRQWYSKILNHTPSNTEILEIMDSIPTDKSLEYIISAVLLKGLSEDESFSKNMYKSNKTFFSQAYLDLNNRGINSNLLNKYTGSSNGFGDKILVKDLMLKNLLFKTDTLDRSVDIYSLMQYEEDTTLEKLPPLMANLYQRPFAIVVFIFVNDIVRYHKYPIAAYQDFLSWQANNIPHSPLGNNEADFIKNKNQKLFYYFEKGIDWVKSYPEEVSTALRKVDQEVKWWQDTLNITSYSNCFAYVYDEFCESYELYCDQLPIDFDYNEQSSVSRQNIIYSAKDMRSDPKGFIEDLYNKLYSRSPTEDELNYLVKYIAANPEITPEVICYSIMTSDEYNFF